LETPIDPDFRDLFGEVVTAHLGIRQLDQIFPSRAAGAGRFAGGCAPVIPV